MVAAIPIILMVFLDYVFSIGVLKYNNQPGSFPSIQAYTTDFKLLADRLCMAKEKWSAGNLKQE